MNTLNETQKLSWKRSFIHHYIETAAEFAPDKVVRDFCQQLLDSAEKKVIESDAVDSGLTKGGSGG